MSENINNTLKVKKSTNFRILLSEKQYIKDLLANIIRFGDGIDTLAFALLVYEITGSKALLAITFGISGIPNMVFGIFQVL
ncbi:hypothetical protein [Clostridium neonatale]|uniref:Uncharacterized protein n=1 Tax=Clostridium neonatale TaxID=137838 RepID=A0AA86JKF3_9CLOT|nr:hypothetical protein CNEO_30010 [Clostridium neonatale]